MNEKKIMQDTSAYFDDPTPVTVRTGKKEHKFLFHELSKGDADQLYKPVREVSEGTESQKHDANQALVLAAVERIVSSEAGEFFTAEQIVGLPVNLLNKLGRKAVAFMSGNDVEDAGEDEEKVVAPDGQSQEQTEAPKD